MKQSMHLVLSIALAALSLIGCDRQSLDMAAAGKLDYVDAGERQRLKEALQRAGVPFETHTDSGGREEIWYESRFEEDVRDIRDGLFGVPPPMGRSISLGAERNLIFMEELQKRNAAFQVVKYRGDEYIAWGPESDEAADAALQAMSISTEGFAELGKMRQAADAERRDRTNRPSRSREERAPAER